MFIRGTEADFDAVVATEHLKCFVVDLTTCEEERGDFFGVVVEGEAAVGISSVYEALGAVDVVVVDSVSELAWEGEQIKNASPLVHELFLGELVGGVIGTYLERGVLV